MILGAIKIFLLTYLLIPEGTVFVRRTADALVSLTSGSIFLCEK